MLFSSCSVVLSPDVVLCELLVLVQEGFFCCVFFLLCVERMSEALPRVLELIVEIQHASFSQGKGMQ